MYVLINKDIIKKNTNYIGDEISNYNDGLNDIRNTIDDISNIWQGNDYNNFKSQMDEFIQSLQNIGESLENYKNYLEGYVNASDKLENYYNNEKISLK